MAKPVVALGLIGAGLGVVVLANSLFTVKETEQVMVLSLGKVDRLVAEPGLDVRVPFYQQIMRFDKRLLHTESEASEFVSKDKKRIVVDSFTRWRIVDAKNFFEAVRTVDIARARLNTIVNSSIQRVLAREDLKDIVSGDRARIMASILEEARREVNRLGIEVVEVRIKRTDLPKENSDAIYNRMRAERSKEAKEIRATGEEEAQKIRANAERERTIMLAEAERKAQALRGQGDADAMKVLGDAYAKDPEFFVLLRSLDAYRTGLKGQDTLMVLDPSMEFLKPFSKGGR